MVGLANDRGLSAVSSMFAGEALPSVSLIYNELKDTKRIFAKERSGKSIDNRTLSCVEKQNEGIQLWRRSIS